MIFKISIRKVADMKKISMSTLADTVVSKRAKLNMSLQKLSDLTGIHRLQIGRLEKCEYLPSLTQIEKLCEVLRFDFSTLFTEETAEDVFVALRGKAQTEAEQRGVEKMISMMLCLRKHDVLRQRLHV